MTTTAAESVVVRYEPRGAARELFRTRDSEVVLAGPAGTGKSLAALFRVHLAALHNPGIRCLIARKTAVSLGSTTLVTYEKKVAADAIARSIVSWFGGSAREAACYRYSNGSVIVVGGLDKPEKILSAEYDLVFVDEATELTETDWETIGTRLRNGVLSWQQQIAACNPAHPTHWIKQRAERGQMRMLVSRHVDNPAYVNADGSLTEKGADYFNKLDALTGVRRLRFRDGVWAAAEGLIYETFDEAVHVVEPFKIPQEWTRWLAVDFGYTNPMVMQWWAEDGDGRLYLYRETYRSQRLVEDHARTALSLTRFPNGQLREPLPRAVVCDHDAEDRATLEKHLGLSTIAAKKTVSDGIQAVQSRLKVQDDGRPRLFIVRGALAERDDALAERSLPTCTAEEVAGYVWAVKPGTGGAGLKEQPLKENDHGLDALRYVVAERDLGGRPQLRWVG
ncbi:phage terminase large subunit [Streptomyces sp. NPDC059759]|uniref:phage terminase large subunit n=1 Tax=Streptomyces sp. NPDC059759 TaxID=3346936 RepID=UPI003656A2FE